MTILEAVQSLRPGTAWAHDVRGGQILNLRQAEDGTPRVTIPTDREIQDAIAAADLGDQTKENEKRQAVLDLKNASKTDSERFDALIKVLGL